MNFVTSSASVTCVNSVDYDSANHTLTIGESTQSQSFGTITDIYPPQIQAALQIFEEFKKGKNHVILNGEMQSGKSGVELLVAYLFSKRFRLSEQCHKILKKDELPNWSEIKNCFLPDFRYNDLPAKRVNVVFICPIRDNNLLEQHQLGLRDVHGNPIIPSTHIMSVPQMQKLVKTPGRFRDFFRKGDDNLIILDESHFCQDRKDSKTKKSTLLFSLMTELGTSLNGLHNELGVKILSVSATPYSEMVSLKYPSIRNNKSIVILKTTEDYYGVRCMLENGRVFPAVSNAELLKDVEEGEIHPLVELFRKYQGRKGYGIMRLGTIPKFQRLQELISELQLNEILCDITYFHSQKGKTVGGATLCEIKDLDGILQQKPKGFHLLIIANALRAGKRLDSRNILFGWDWSDAPDATHQGLLGRFCGFHKKKYRVDIYCNYEHIEPYINLRDAMHKPETLEDVFSYIPRGSRNVTGGVSKKSKNNQFRHYEVPRFKLSPELIAHIQRFKSKTQFSYVKLREEGKIENHFRKLSFKDKDGITTTLDNLLTHLCVEPAVWGAYNGVFVAHTDNTISKNWNKFGSKSPFLSGPLNYGKLSLSNGMQGIYYYVINLTVGHKDYGQMHCIITIRQVEALTRAQFVDIKSESVYAPDNATVPPLTPKPPLPPAPALAPRLQAPRRAPLSPPMPIANKSIQNTSNGVAQPNRIKLQLPRLPRLPRLSQLPRLPRLLKLPSAPKSNP